MSRADDHAPLNQPARRKVLKAIGAASLGGAAASMLPGWGATARAATAGPATASTIDWSGVTRVSKTAPTLQVVVNPLIRRGSPIHDAVFSELRALRANYVRFVPWYPYPRLGVAELTPPTATGTSWDFDVIDPLVEDFQTATRGHSTIMNFSTIPEWMWEQPWTIADGRLYAVGGSNGVATTGTTWTDYTFAADVTPVASATHNGEPYAQAAMIFRMDATGRNGYGFLISNYPYSSPAAPGYVVSVKFTGGAAGSVVATPLPFAINDGQTYHVEITVSGSTFTVAVNGTTADTLTDSTYTAGTVGFREYSAESAYFDNATVTTPSGTVLLTDDFSNGLGQWAPPGTPPDDPDAVDFGYSGGTKLAVPLQTVADYYRRLVGWYTAGGFTDENGTFHASPHHYQFPYWEVLNELEHGLSPEYYTQIYDAIVTEIAKVSPRTKFVGIAMATPSSTRTDYFSYFLDPANHQPGVPIDWISYHFYAHVTAAQQPDDYGSTGFPKADSFLSVVDQIEAIRTQLAPHVRTTVDETGTIMDAAATETDPVPIPNAYWNYSGAIYAYVLANLALRGIDVVGESQMVGYPSQYPSVSMVDWETGLPNARYRVLQLLLEEMPAGLGLVPITAAGDYYLLGLTAPGVKRILAINKTNDTAAITISGIRGATARVVDQASAGAAIRTERVATDTFSLGGYGVAVLSLAEPS